MVVVLGDRRRPAGRHIVVRRIDHDEAPQQNQRCQREAVDDEDALHAGQAKHAGRVEQAAEPRSGQLDPDGGAETEAGDGQAGNQALLVGKPLDANRDRHDVGKANAGAADNADAQQLRPEVAAVYTAHQVATAQE